VNATAEKLPETLPSWWLHVIRYRNAGPQRLDAQSSRDVRWYAGRPPLAALPATGSVGGQLERAAALGLGPVPCRKCGGYWRADDNGDIVEWRDASGWFPSTRHFPGRPTYAQALATYRRQVIRDQKLTVVGDNGNEAALELVREEAKKHGLTVVTEEQFRVMVPHIPEELCDECKRCKGLRVVERRSHSRGEITAYPTGSSKKGSGGRWKQETEALADGDVQTSGIYWEGLARWNRVDENLCRVGNVAEVARVALERFHEPDHAGWVLGIQGDARMAGWDALDVLTPEGQHAAGDLRGEAAERYLQQLRKDPASVIGGAAIVATMTRQRSELFDASCALYMTLAVAVPE
jgi:hypothetical protein